MKVVDAVAQILKMQAVKYLLACRPPPGQIHGQTKTVDRRKGGR